MPEQSPSAVYHLDFGGRIPPGRLVHAVEQPGGTVDVYFHRLHVREPLLWELNWLTQHHVGFEYWRQRWSREAHEGRMQEDPEGLDIVTSTWEIVPSYKMPEGRYIFPVERKGACIWKVRAGYCTVPLLNEKNQLLARIAGDGLWEQTWDEDGELPIPRPLPALVAPPLMPASI